MGGLYLIGLALSIYITILIIQVLRRGVKALDIYIKNNETSEDNPNDNYYSKYDK